MIPISNQLCTILLTLLISLITSEKSTDIWIQYLSTDNFRDFVDEHSHSVVMFFAPWCTHSKSFLPVFDAIAGDLSSDDLHFAKVDCVEQKEIYWKNNIESFPTIKFYFGKSKGLEPIEFKGEREVDEITLFIERLKKESIIEQNLDFKMFAQFKESFLTPLNPLAIYFNIQKENNANFLISFNNACKQIENIRCVISSDQALADLFELPANASLTIFSSYEMEESIFHAQKDSMMSTENMIWWLRSYSYPLLVQFREEDDGLMFSQHRLGFSIHILIVVNTKDMSTETSRVLVEVEEVAAAFRGRCVFIALDMSDQSDYSQSIRQTLVDEPLPTVWIIESLKSEVKFYNLPRGTAITQRSLRDFVGQFFSRSLRPSRWPAAAEL